MQGTIQADWVIPTLIHEGDFTIGKPCKLKHTMDWQEFVAAKTPTYRPPGVIPVPKQVDVFHYGKLNGHDVLISRVGDELFVLTEVIYYGFALFHYLWDVDDNAFMLAAMGGATVINFSLEDFNMNLAETLKRSAAAPLRNPALDAAANKTELSPIELEHGPAPTHLGIMGAMPAVPAGESITGRKVDPMLLKKQIVCTSYFVGCIMGTAPNVQLKLQSKTVKSTNTSAAGSAVDNSSTAVKEYSLHAVESRPSKLLSVILAMPSKLVSNGGTLATPSEIMNANVDWQGAGDPVGDITYHILPENAAIAYIHSFGDKLAEHAYITNACDARFSAQWSPADLTGMTKNSEKIAWVYIRPSKVRSEGTTESERFKFHLKVKVATGRRSLYTPHNIVCLKGYKHMDISARACSNPTVAAQINDTVFGYFATRSLNKDSQNETQLTRILQACPEQVWVTQHEDANGLKVDSFQSSFFLPEGDVVREDGRKVNREDLIYKYWYEATTDKSAKHIANRLVERTRDVKSDGKTTWKTTPVTLEENPTDPSFSQYNRFFKLITEEWNIITPARLFAMGKTTRVNIATKKTLTPEENVQLNAFIGTSDVMDEIQQARSQSADRLLVSNG